MSSEKTENFAKAYENLKNIADLMRSRDIDDVDELLKHVEDGTKSYKVCKERLELAEKKLKDILEDDDVATNTTLIMSAGSFIVLAVSSAVFSIRRSRWLLC